MIIKIHIARKKKQNCKQNNKDLEKGENEERKT